MIPIFAAFFILLSRSDRLVTAQPVPAEILSSFSPISSFGCTIDGHEFGSSNQIFTPHNLKLMKNCGANCLSYRLRTELGCEAWHWNPIGTWSNPKEKSGYWTSSAAPSKPILISYGYRLPRRGNTYDQANNTGFSRIDDGDSRTFWKSNPYLSKPYTHVPDNEHPQWVVVDLGVGRKVNTLKINWGNPYATKFSIQFWNGPNIYDADHGSWIPFRNTSRLTSKGGLQVIQLISTNQKIRWVRIWMTDCSSTSCTPEKAPFDLRDAEGYSIRELYCGYQTSRGFHDYIIHGHAHQTQIVVSSTDPWHTAKDIDRQTEQSGIDRVLNSGLTHGQPILVPVPTLYGTPEDASNFIRYLKGKHVAIRGVELGEEPDGQLVEPKDYGALYIQDAKAIKSVMPGLPCGGPCYQSTEWDYSTYPQPASRPRWSTLFMRYLEQEHAVNLFNFFSFEWYPYDDVAKDRQEHLLQQPQLLSETILDLKKQGIPSRIPWYITEYGYSAFGGEAEVTREGALMDCEIVGTGLENGISALYLYGTEASTIMDETNSGSYGNNIILLSNNNGQATAKTARYYSEQLITRYWAAQLKTPLKVIAVKLKGKNKQFVRAYCLLIGKKKYSWLVLNTSMKEPIRFKINGIGAKVKSYQLGPEQYQWKANKENGFPIVSKELKSSLEVGSQIFLLPPLSITVIKSVN